MNPVEMSKEVLGAMRHGYELDSYATHELRGLFNDWLIEIELQLIEFVDRRKHADPEDLARYFKLTTESVIFILAKLTREGKIKIQAHGSDTGHLHLVTESKKCGQ